MAPVGSPSPPSSSLPPLRSIDSLTEEEVFYHLESLCTLYCPLAFKLGLSQGDKTVDPLVDSGYASETEQESDAEESLNALRTDDFERKFTEQWLARFIASAEGLACFASEEACERAIDQASLVLESFVATPADERQQEELSSYAREFSFEVSPLDPRDEKPLLKVRLNDGLAGMNSSEPGDVGLQSWGASIVVSRLLCAEPDRFCLTEKTLGASPRIIELGAGTGLISLVLGALLPQLDMAEPTILATDFHPAVLANLRANVATNFPSQDSTPVQTCLLDWSAPSLEAPLDVPADMLIAADVVYAPEHAVWLRDCATLLLGPEGVFWLVATVRPNGRFEGVGDTVEAAFTASDRPKGDDGRQLTILHGEKLEKQTGVGRGDESGYKLFRIGWA